MKKDQENVPISSFKIQTVIISIVFIAFLISGCAPKKLNPLTLPIEKADLQEAQFPPTEDELVLRPYILLPLITATGPTVTKARLDDLRHFIHSSLESHGNFSVISAQHTAALLNKEENRHFQAGNIADAIQLGTSLNANFVSQMEMTIIESKMVDSVDHFKANVNLTIFTTDSGQVVIKRDIVYDSQELEDSEAKLRQLVQTYFPIRGYILETRGGHQVAKISLGRNAGIKLGRKIQVRERSVKSEIVNGVSRRTVTFGAAALTMAEVTRVQENDSWIQINKGDQHKIRIGQVIFTVAE